MKREIKSLENETSHLVKKIYCFYSKHLRFIVEKSPQNAGLVADTLFDIGDKLNIFPEKNPREPIYNQDSIRFFPKWNFKIVYRIEQDRIYILDVFSTLKNPKNFKI